MAFKEVSLVELIEVIRRWQTGPDQRAVARTHRALPQHGAQLPARCGGCGRPA